MASLLARVRTMATTVTARRPAAVSFCDGCGRVCDAVCRAEAVRSRVQYTMLTAGSRI